jgi:predicted alpha/beta hydrolase family esterase
MTPTLIVPGLSGSEPAHWQSWFEHNIQGTSRVEQTDWETPDITRWANAVGDMLEAAIAPVWIVAHSFGCLASVVAINSHPSKVAGAMVAPADPDRFDLAYIIPEDRLPCPSVVVASTNDPWVRLMTAGYWANRWGSHFINLGAAGHINVDSGFGPWPEGLALFDNLRRAQTDLLLRSRQTPFGVACDTGTSQSVAVS